ncbi:unnamed protein product [Rotaria magnacalcarata]|uniref:Ricin B lectin domain-containing protein n=2 Tax=Rotaria magnacalcarata TaxID=392030 RepID=A0A815AU11_9BILA|nr:unnamed protein product [Rotaria magnacalcarata]
MSILSLAIRVESQTCDKMNQYDPCSQNYACACFHRLDGPNATICIDEFSISCSELIPCESSANRCYEAEHICVRHPRCNQLPVCYPVPIFNQQLCPSIPTTTATIPSHYSSSLTTSNSKFIRPNSGTGAYYYEAIHVTIETSGTYTFVSSSGYDIYGCLYNTPFSASSPSLNLITYNDDSGGENEFQLTADLKFFQPVILVVTTYQASRTGAFAVTAYGPNTVTFTKNAVKSLTTMITTTKTIASTAIASSGTYQLLSVLSNKALDVYGNDTQDGANVQIFSNNGGKSQRWIVYANEDDTVKLINENSGKALDLTNYDASINSNVEIRTQNGGKGQKWTLKPVGDGTYYVINALSGKVLDVLSSGTADETNVHTCGQNNSGAQKWRIFRCS